MQKTLPETQHADSPYYIPSFLQSTPAAVLAVAVLYFIISKLSFPIVTATETVSPFFPGIGLGLAAVIVLGRKAVLGVWLGSLVFTVELVLSNTTNGNITGLALLEPILMSIGVATASLLSLILGLYLLKVFEIENYPMKTGKSSLRFTLLCLLVSLIRPTIVAGGFAISGSNLADANKYSWIAWWRGDVIGIIIITPFVLSWLYKHHIKDKETYTTIIEKVAFVLIAILVCLHVFGAKTHDEFMVVAILFWAAYRYGMRGATSASLIMSACAIYYTYTGQSLFFNDLTYSPVLLLQIFIFSNIAYSLFLAAILSERKSAEIELKKHSQMLNERVKELNCLNHISEIAKRGELSKPEMIQLCIPEIVKGFQFPDIMGCRIIFRGEEFSSENFTMTPWFLHHKIIIEGNTLGGIEVCYLGKPNTDEEVFLEEEEVLMKSISDIIGKSIEGKIALRKLVENQNILQSTIESPKGIRIYALDRNYRYLTFNQLQKDSIKSVYGIDIKPGMSILDSITDKRHNESIKDTLDRAFKGENIDNITWEKGDQTYWDIKCNPIRYSSNNIVGATVFATDVTQKRKTEEALRLSEVKYRTIFENVHDVFFQTDLSGIILEVSPSVEKYTGQPREKLIGTSTLTEFYYYPNEREIFIKELTEKGVVNDFVIRYITKDESEKYASVTAKIILNADGTQLIEGSLRDITDRVVNEMKIENQNRILQVQNAELEQFAYITSHDLQEPLLTLKHFSDVLKEELDANVDEEISQYLDFITQSSTRMQVLVKGLLEYSRIGNNRKISQVDFNEILKQVKHDLAVAINKTNAKIEVENLPRLQSVTSEMKQLFEHLIGNAIKFRKEGIVPEIKIAATEQEGNWLFTVSDNGIGIDEADKEKIFTIFKRLNNRDEYEGTGIGLSYCKKIVELNGGTIWVDSKLGEGSTFNFILPKN